MEAHDHLGPGLHLVRAADPQREASDLAERFGAALCATVADVDAELERRSAAGPAFSPEVLASLDVLARRLERAERIAERTRARAETDVADRLVAAGAGMAVHPTTIRDRAAAVEAARREVEAAESALAAAAEPGADDRLAADAAVAEAEARAHVAAVLEAPRASGPSAATRRSRSIGAVVAASGLTLVLLGLQVTTLWLALLPVLLAALWAMRYLQPSAGQEDDDDDVASSFLAEVGASTDEIFGARRAAIEHDEGPRQWVLRRDRALEELRVAERAWHELAGPDTDVDAVDEVVRRYDPQHEDARLLAGEVVAVRAADVMRHNLEQQWVATWLDAGADPPSAVTATEAVRAARAAIEAPVVLVGAATERADQVAGSAPAARVIVVQPESEPETG